MKKHILIADDEEGIRELCKDFLESEGYRITLAVDGQDALDKVQEEEFDLYLLDMMMPKYDGYELMKHIKKKYPLAVIIILTGYSSIEGAIRAVHGGAFQYLSKPINSEDLINAVKKGIQYAQDLYGPLLTVFDANEDTSQKNEPIFLRGFTPEEKISLLETGKIVEYKEGEIISSLSSKSDALLMIESGEVSVWLSNTTIDYLQKWDTWNEENFIMAAGSDTKLRAESDVVIKIFDRTMLLNYFATNGERLLKRFIINLVNCNYLKWRKAAQRIVMLKLVTGDN